jgi:hypothetical protein
MDKNRIPPPEFKVGNKAFVKAKFPQSPSQFRTFVVLLKLGPLGATRAQHTS